MQSVSGYTQKIGLKNQFYDVGIFVQHFCYSDSTSEESFSDALIGSRLKRLFRQEDAMCMKIVCKKIIILLAALMFILAATAVPVEARSWKSSSTSKPKEERTCLQPGCNKSVTYPKSNYCPTHTCRKPDCNSGILDGSSFCWMHTDPNKAYKKTTTKKKTTTRKKTSTSKKSTKKKKVVMPDCDDYDSLDDFLDDWDGCMPDGSDAEDYWDNW